MRAKKRIGLLKPYENPTYINVLIRNREIPVKITLLNEKGIIFTVEFILENKMYKREFERITQIDKIYSSDDIEFNDLDMDQFSKAKIASCLNEILDFHFS